MSSIEALVEKLTPAQRELLARLLSPGPKAGGREPIAVIGMACRFPGGSSSPALFQELLLRGGDGITEIPADRFRAEDFYDPRPGVPGKMTSKWGGFLDDVDRFDARFFGVAPREAADMDPQQRLLLEVAHDALEDAGLVDTALAGSATGIFVGTHSHDYSWLSFRDPETVHSYLSTGSSNSIVANRLSYLLDLKGPSLAVDTACSSSLVALHLACRSLASGDCRVALAAGVNVILSPHWGIAVSQLGMLSPDGRCRPFDAAGGGFVRSEGCGVVALKRLSDATADGDRIHAIVRGSFVNQDGRTNGITAPSGHAQQAVVREALTDAGVAPEAIRYIETHGTGTSLGDPIEVEALAAVVGGRRGVDPPCVLGSLKGNVGHLEAAAGIAGFIKVVLALETERIPRQVHFERLNPEIDLAETRFVIPKETISWPRVEGVRRLAGVSSFGFGGTNAHVVIEEGPATAKTVAAGAERKSHLLVVSARSEDALRDLAEKHAARFLSSEDPIEDVCFTAGAKRSHYAHRLAVLGRDGRELSERLSAFVEGRSRDGAYHAVVREKPLSPVFVFSGQGPQWWGMGRELGRSEPVFRRALERCDEILSRHAKWSLFEELGGSEPMTRIAETEIAQPALFSLQVALAELLKSWGIVPGAVLGHSLGEIAAAHVAEVLTLEEAIGLVFQRGRLMQAASGKGKMASIELPLDEVEARLAGLEGAVTVAASNGPRTTVVSGDSAPVEEFLRSLERESIAARLLPVDYAFHSPQMDPIARELETLLAGLAPRPAKIPFVSTVTGKSASGSSLTPSYWRDNVRKPVRFRHAVASLLDSGHRLFVEVGPHPVLSPSIASSLEERSLSEEGRVFPSLRRGRDEDRAMGELLAALHVSGSVPSFEALYPAPRRIVSLPTYPFRRERFPVSAGRADLAEKTAPGIVCQRIRAALPIFEFRVDAEWRSSLAAACVSMAVEAAHRLSSVPLESVTVRTLEILRPLVSQNGGETIQWMGDESGESFRVFSTGSPDSDQWTLNAKGKVSGSGTKSASSFLDIAEIRRRLAQVGEAEVFRGTGEVLAAIELAPELTSERSLYRSHPAVIDACLRPLLDVLDEPSAPVAFDRFVFHRSDASRLWCHGRLRSEDSDAGVKTFDVRIADESGRIRAEIDGIRFKPASERSSSAPSLYEVQWRPSDLAPSSASNRAEWLLISDRDTVASSLESVLLERGDRVRRVRSSEIAPAIESSRARRVGVVHLGSLGTSAEDPLEDLEPVAESLLAIVRTLAEKRPDLETRLFLVTRGCQAIGEGTQPLRLSGSMLWGLGAALALENPELRPVLVDLDPEAPPDETRALGSVLAFDLDESRIGFRSGRAFVARLAPMVFGASTNGHGPDAHGESEPLDSEARYLVTGGLGAIGLAVARWLASKGARHLVLAGRRGASPDAEKEIESLRGAGVKVSVAAADVSRKEDVRRLVARAVDGRPLKGIVHAAGVLDDGIFLRQSWKKLLSALAPKVQGALHLHRETTGEPLDFFIALSSMASVLGSAGQTGYSAANAFLDALSFERRRQGLPATSVSFGPFDGAGMAARIEGRDRYREQGIRKTKPEETLALLERLRHGPPHTLAVSIDWEGYVRALPTRVSTSLFREIAPSARSEREARAAIESIPKHLENIPAAKRRAEVEARVRGHILLVLGLPEGSALDPYQGFRDAGLDSLMAVEARNRIRVDFPDLVLATTLCFDYPTLGALTDYLMKALHLDSAPARTEPASRQARIEDLSEAEAEALLLEELEGRRS